MEPSGGGLGAVERALEAGHTTGRTADPRLHIAEGKGFAQVGVLAPPLAPVTSHSLG